MTYVYVLSSESLNKDTFYVSYTEDLTTNIIFPQFTMWFNKPCMYFYIWLIKEDAKFDEEDLHNYLSNNQQKIKDLKYDNDTCVGMYNAKFDDLTQAITKYFEDKNNLRTKTNLFDIFRGKFYNNSLDNTKQKPCCICNKIADKLWKFKGGILQNDNSTSYSYYVGVNCCYQLLLDECMKYCPGYFSELYNLEQWSVKIENKPTTNINH